jgi:diacylglycerol kinase family enzyme
MHAAIILNEKAGGALPGGGNGSPFTLDALRSALAEARIDSAVQLCPPGAVVDRVRAVMAARNGTDAIVVGGGDGTLSGAAGVLAHSDMPLGILPLGTMNHFAKDLGIPFDVEGCVRTLATAPPRPVDLAAVNGRLFLNNCSIGAYPAAVRRRDALRRLRGFGKWRAMFLASLEVLRQLRRLHVRIEADGEPLVRRTPFVIVSNNRYAGQILSRQLRPRLDEGTLCTYTTRAHRTAPLLRLAWAALTVGIEAANELESRAAENVTVNLEENTPAIATDGEVFNVTSPLLFRIHPRALQVLAPPAVAPGQLRNSSS